MDNNTEFSIAKLNQRTSVITTVVTVVCSLLGSIIVALIVGHLTIKASVEATRLSNQAQEDLLKKTIESQLSIASKANNHQEMVAIKTMDNNLIIAEKSIKNALDVIERDNELRHKEKVEEERRARHAKKTYAINYLLSDIGIRTLYLERILNGIEPYVEKITKSAGNTKSNLRLISELEMKQALSSHEMVSWSISQDVYKQAMNLTPKIQSNILLFYRSIEKFSYISRSANNIESTDIKNGLKEVLNSSTTSQLEKELALEMYQTMSIANFSGATNFLSEIVLIGLRNMTTLQKELEIENKEILEKLSKYEKLSKNPDETYFSSMKSLFEQVDRVQKEILEKNH